MPSPAVWGASSVPKLYQHGGSHKAVFPKGNTYMSSNTLTLKKSGSKQGGDKQLLVQKKPRIEHAIVNKSVVVQGKSPSHWQGRVESFDGGWLILNGEEHRWMADGSLSGVVCRGRFSIDRSAIGYICEVNHD